MTWKNISKTFLFHEVINYSVSDIFCDPMSLILSWNLKCFTTSTAATATTATTTTAAAATTTTAAVSQLAKKVVFVLISLLFLTHYAKNPIK
jgi:hypothetical protein